MLFLCKMESIIKSIDFTTEIDESNWSSDVGSTVSTVDNKLQFVSGSVTSKFVRVLGSSNPSHTVLRFRANIEIIKQIGTGPSDVEYKFDLVKQSGEVIHTVTIYLSQILDLTSYQYFIDREIEVSQPLGDVYLSITNTTNIVNILNLINLQLSDYEYSKSEIRTYFAIQELFDTYQTAGVDISKAGIELQQFKVDNVETLTAEYFNENNIIVGSLIPNWKFAKAKLDGTNRVEETAAPNTFNPFVSEFGLLFDAANFYSGKPTGTVSGSNYGSGLLQIGTDKPIILNGNLDKKNGAFFIDIDYTKNLKVVFNVIVNSTNVNIYVEPEIYREYTIEWDSVNCIRRFSYKDKLNNNTVVNIAEDGFLSGVTPFVNEPIQEEETIVFDADYMVLTYNFADGRDLDTRTRLVIPAIGQNTTLDYLGWGFKQMFPAVDPVITFGGDNTGTGKESVLIDVKKIKTLYPLADEILADFRGFWYGVVGNQNVSLGAKLYKGGTMVKDGFTWKNDDATETLNFDSIGKPVVGPIVKNANNKGQRISTFRYNIITKVGTFDANDTTTPEV